MSQIWTNIETFIDEQLFQPLESVIKLVEAIPAYIIVKLDISLRGDGRERGLFFYPDLPDRDDVP